MLAVLKRDDRTVITLFAALTALGLGVFIGTQPPIIAITVIGALLLALCAVAAPLAGFVILSVLAPLRTLVATEAAFQLPLDAGQITFILLFAAYTVNRVAHHRRLIYFHWSALYPPLLVFVIATGLSGFAATSMGAWLNEWLKWVIVLLLVALVIDLGRGQWRWLAFGLVLAGVANALIGIYIFFGGSGALHLLISNRFFRAFGTFGQPNPFGGFMGLLAPIAVMLAYGSLLKLWQSWRLHHHVEAKNIAMLTFYTVASMLIVIGVFVSWSRGAWLGFGASMAVLLFAAPPRLWQGALLIVISGLLVGGAWATGQLPAPIVDRIGSATQELFVLNDVRAVDITSENYAIVERLSHWQAALNMMRDAPWLGVGFGNYEVVYDQYRLINWQAPLGHAHNYYLNVFAEAGMIGLTAYLALLASLVWFAWGLRAHPDPLSRSIGIGLLGTWAYLAAHSLTDNLYVNNIFLHFGIMIGILAHLRREIYERGNIGNR